MWVGSVCMRAETSTSLLKSTARVPDWLIRWGSGVPESDCGRILPASSIRTGSARSAILFLLLRVSNFLSTAQAIMMRGLKRARQPMVTGPGDEEDSMRYAH